VAAFQAELGALGVIVLALGTTHHIMSLATTMLRPWSVIIESIIGQPAIHGKHARWDTPTRPGG